MNTSGRMFYRHASKRAYDWSSMKDVLYADIETFVPIAIAYEEEHTPKYYTDKYYVCMPMGGTLHSFATANDAIALAEEQLLLAGWTLDMQLALRRAKKEVELRQSGRMKFAGPSFSQDELDACRREVMAVT